MTRTTMLGRRRVLAFACVITLGFPVGAAAELSPPTPPAIPQVPPVTPQLPAVPPPPNVTLPSVSVPSTRAPAPPSVPQTPATPAVPSVSVPSIPVAAPVRVSKVAPVSAPRLSAGVSARKVSLRTKNRTGGRAWNRSCKQGWERSTGGRCVRVGAKVRLYANPHCPSAPPGTTVHCTNQPLAGELYDSCNNAFVTILPGSTWHFRTQVTVNPLTQTIVTERHSNFQNVAGIGSNGNKYQANDTQKSRTAMYPFPLGLSFRIDETVHENQELISLGPLANQIIHEQVRTVVEVDLSNPFDPVVVIEEEAKGPGLRCRG